MPSVAKYPARMVRTLTVLLAALLIGCGEDPPAPSEPDPDATLRIAHNFILTRFDPHRATSSYDNTWLYPVYDRLVHVDPDGNAVPGLATAWHFAADGSYWNSRCAATFTSMTANRSTPARSPRTSTERRRCAVHPSARSWQTSARWRSSMRTPCACTSRPRMPPCR